MGRRVPLRDMEHRPPEAGRLRFGVEEQGVSKSGKRYTRPKAIGTWRFTSPDRGQVEAAASVYGGEVEPWNNAKATPPKQWQCISPTPSIDVWLPPDGLTTSYEHWTAKGCERRCDGEMCVFNGRGQREEMSCLCALEEGRPLCKVKSRLNVLLPGVPFSGVWRMETASEYFAMEAPGTLNIIWAQMERRIVPVRLVLDQRTQKSIDGEGKPVTSHFVVPKIVIDATLFELSTGPALGPGPVRELAPGPPEDVWHPSFSDDDEIVEAEVIEMSDYRNEPDGWDVPPPDVAVRRNPRFGEPGQPKYIRKD